MHQLVCYTLPSMKSLFLIILVFCLSLLSGCMMPNPKEQIAVNEIKLVKEGYVHPEKGEQAPAVQATDQTGKQFDLSQALQNGPVLLFFYPANDTPNSTNQLRQLSRLQQEFTESGAGFSILAVNPAAGSKTAAYLDKEQISIPVLEDPGLRISQAYGCASSNGNTQMQERSVVGISPDGSIAFFQRRYFHRPPSIKLLLSEEYFNMPVE